MRNRLNEDLVNDLFHPLIAHWFHKRLGEPTAPQAAGWPRSAKVWRGRDEYIASLHA